MKKIVFLFIISLTFNLSASSQTKKLVIKVTDENNKPIPGAIILFDNVRQKSWTNSKGVFKTKIEETPEEISAFSPKIGIGKVKYSGQEVVHLKILKGKDKNLISVEDQHNNVTANAFQYRNIYDYLVGKVPGVNVVGTSIMIRGVNTVNGSTTPLFVFNGTIVSQSYFGQIVPTDIKSVTILKGPESAKYGIRGANGVIEVTSK
ncbi:TonB-dependent receptor plug domain-containing protein [Tenacibaculum tangerinum]|uniref:TonB-dependent receptor plug domain-containing protein n=1 Tax=Tenacibaculum tangerinum TaxID=3038772 RepID=A0ABY8L2F2_9FLAO|nr:TonB-dependent receptor plug domain-containing protein [Tenacibaculum tangerinum]WGH75286.1 TonB-dependent receptor plug domain-containing protein [Tenacibaculum tangerinum]